MCVIIHSLRKKYLKRCDVVNAMKHNSSGFFMSHWNYESKSYADRKSIRTLNESDALAFFDNVPDDNVFVMHARIPSKGGVSLSNVHGWEEDNIAFCHNMTMSSLSSVMTTEEWNGTDSEYFFRKLFLPMHRGEHACNPELGVSEMGPATKRLVSVLCGETNKFLFVMPDNTVIRAGKWDPLEKEKVSVEEEREIDEVIGESIDITGHIQKKTNKVKKIITVEREMATVLASNTYFRSTYSASNLPLHEGYTYSKGYSIPEKTYPATSYSSSYSSSGYDSEYIRYYGDDYEEWVDSKPDKSDSQAKKFAEITKFKYKKNSVSCEEIEQFCEWRKSVPNFEAPKDNVLDVIDSSAMFGGLIYSNGRFNKESLVDVFNYILRCIIYFNIGFFNDNVINSILPDNVLCPDDIRLFSAYYKDFVEFVIPNEFNDETFDLAVATLTKISDGLCSSNDKLLKLPSEVVRDAFTAFIKEFESLMGKQYDGFLFKNKDTSSATALASPLAADSIVDDFNAKINVLDTIFNISFNSNLKTCKNIDKYVKMGVVHNRKIDWISTALILGTSPKNIEKCQWANNATTQVYVNILNTLSEICTSDSDVLDELDKKYIYRLKATGYDFTKKGSPVPGSDNNGQEQVKKESSVDVNSDVDKDCSVQYSSNILGEPEAAENPKKE